MDYQEYAFKVANAVLCSCIQISCPSGAPHVEVHLLPLKSSYSESTLIKTGMLNSSNNKSPLFSGLSGPPTTFKVLGEITFELVCPESAHGEVLQRSHPDKEDDPCCLSWWTLQKIGSNFEDAFLFVHMLAPSAFTFLTWPNRLITWLKHA